MSKSVSNYYAALLLVCMSFAPKANAQDWETFDNTFHGQIGKAKITLTLVDRFGKLQGSYYYDRFKKLVHQDPRNDNHTIYLEGSKHGDSIYLTQTCWYCKEVENPEVFEGRLIDARTIRGSWFKPGIPEKQRFQLVANDVVDSSDRPPIHPEAIREYDRKDIWASKFFEQPFVREGLASVLQQDLLPFIRFLQQPMARSGLFITADSLLTLELWVEHNGPSDQSIIKVDLKTKQFYIYWCGAPGSYIKVYGDHIPPSVLEGFADSMNHQWGFSRRYFVTGQTIGVESKEKK